MNLTPTSRVEAYPRFEASLSSRIPVEASPLMEVYEHLIGADLQWGLALVS
jgi:hypothetical protein